MNKKSKVNKISEDSLRAIIAKSPESLPLRPSDAGISPQQIRAHFYKYVTDEEKSIVGEINRVVAEQNEINRDLLQFKDSIAGDRDFKTEAKEIVGAVNEIHDETDALKQRLFGGSGSLISSTVLPSYVDDVLECDNYGAFPEEGESGKIYVDAENNDSYRWSAASKKYLLVGVGSAVESMRGKAEKVLYAVDSEKIDCAVQYSAEATPGSVILRDGEGRARVSAPEADDDAANKKYVDGRIPVRAGEGDNSLIVNEGDAVGASSIAGGTTDTDLIKSVLGGGYARLIDKYGNVANMSDTVISIILKAVDAGYTATEFKRMLTVTPAAAEGILAIALGVSNKAKTAGAISLGYGNISGARGYYITAINTANRTITLSTKQDETTAPTNTVNWAKGDRLFIVNDDRYWCEISSVSGNVITLTNMPFTSLAELKKVSIPLVATYDVTAPNERSVINIDKPESGEVDMGWGAVGIGALNTILGSNAFGVGYKNLIAGDFGASFGQENEVGYSAFAAGILNKALGKASLAIGDSNTAGEDYSQAFGKQTVASGKRSLASGDETKATSSNAVALGYKTSANGENSVAMGNNCHTYANSAFCGGLLSEVSHYGSFVYGQRLKSSRSYQTVLGMDNADNSNALLIIGNGTSSSDKSNAFEVLKDGTAVVDKIESGEGCEASGEHTLAGGYKCKSKHRYTITYGSDLSTSRDFQAVFGYDNMDNPDAFLIVGRGEYTKGNAFEVICKNGASSIKVGNTEITEEQLIELKLFSGVFDNSVFEKIYPIGAIYMSLKDTSPAELFGGTWEKLTNRFLIGAGDSYTLGATGGEATHTLTVAEMPAHSHEVKFDNTFSVGTGSGSHGSKDTDCYVNITKATRSGTLAAVQKGGGTAHNNLPPYIAVNIWRRTA